MKRPLMMAAFVGLAALAHLACGGGGDEASRQSAVEGTKKVEHVALGEFVTPEDSLPRIRYFDGDQVSLNDRCPVRKVKLNPKMPPVYVNGRPVGFC